MVRFAPFPGGTYGWKVDTNSLSQEVYDALVAGGATSVDIPAANLAIPTMVLALVTGVPMWMLIFLSKRLVITIQVAICFIPAVWLQANPSRVVAHPPVYYLNNKQSPCTLIGYKPNGEKDYETKVTYWMPFIGNSIGLHDATWQSSFGGTRYQTNGSHGCVNLSSGDAQWFYQNLNKGVCIITHN